MEFLGLTADQLMTLAGLALALLVVWLVLSVVLKLTKSLLKLGCAGIVILLAVALLVLRACG